MTAKNLLVVHHTVPNWEDLSRNRTGDTNFLLYNNDTVETENDIITAAGSISNIGFVWDHSMWEKFPFLPDTSPENQFISERFRNIFKNYLSGA